VHVELPASGESAELRTALKAKDKFAVQGAVSISGGASAQGGVISVIETALLARLMESWTFDNPLPSKHACQDCTGDSAKWHEHVRDEFGEILDVDDWNELEKAITPMLKKVMQAPNLETSSASAASS
jgi:hypothetical protein